MQPHLSTDTTLQCRLRALDRTYHTCLIHKRRQSCTAAAPLQGNLDGVRRFTNTRGGQRRWLLSSGPGPNDDGKTANAVPGQRRSNGCVWSCAPLKVLHRLCRPVHLMGHVSITRSPHSTADQHRHSWQQMSLHLSLSPYEETSMPRAAEVWLSTGT